jgi:putative membrane protein
MEHIVNVLKGIVIGIANAIPGVSGGTMMVIMKVFDKLLGAVSVKNLKKNLPFLIPIVLGMGIGVILSAKVLTACFDIYYVQTQMFFLGVILGSLPMIYKEGISKGKFKPLHLIPFLVGMAIIIIVTMANSGSSSVYTELTAGTFIYLMIVSVISAAAMIMPGLSGSLVLLMLGGYQTMLQAVDEMNIPILIPIGAGVILGVVLCAKVITICLKKCYKGTYAVIIGMILGSVYAIFPRQTIDENGVLSGADFSITSSSGVFGIITCIIGILLPLGMMVLDKKKGKDSQAND